MKSYLRAFDARHHLLLAMIIVTIFITGFLIYPLVNAAQPVMAQGTFARAYPPKNIHKTYFATIVHRGHFGDYP